MKKTLRQWRRDREMTQAQLAAAVGIHENTYKKYEHCPGEVRIKTLIALCDVLGISISDVKLFVGNSREVFREQEEEKEGT